MVEFKPHQRLALQAVVAVALAALFEWAFQLERSYWSMLTAMLLISQTWGESIKKALERVSMTVVGCILGTVIYFIIGPQHLIIFLTLLISIFFAVFFLNKNYAFATLFISLFVVFLFAEIQAWDLTLLYARIHETLLGAVIAIFVSGCVLPIKAENKLTPCLNELLDKFSELSGQCIDNLLLSSPAYYEQTLSRNALLAQYHRFVQQLNAMNFEYIYTGPKKRRLRGMALQLNNLQHYITSFMEISLYKHRTTASMLVKKELFAIKSAMAHNFTQIKLALAKQPHLKLVELSEQRQEIRERLSQLAKRQDIPKQEFYDCYTSLYFLEKINQSLFDLYHLTL